MPSTGFGIVRKKKDAVELEGINSLFSKALKESLKIEAEKEARDSLNLFLSQKPRQAKLPI